MIYMYLHTYLHTLKLLSIYGVYIILLPCVMQSAPPPPPHTHTQYNIICEKGFAQVVAIRGIHGKKPLVPCYWQPVTIEISL